MIENYLTNINRRIFVILIEAAKIDNLNN